jgi:tRNA (guanine-N7-)-methyltransferase
VTGASPSATGHPVSLRVTTVEDLLAGRAGTHGCEVEIGCGNGHFLVSYASGRPRTLLIGIDIKARRCRKAEEKAEKRGLANIAIVHGAAEVFIRDMPPCSARAFHIYFPDPWPKSRHRKRRFFTMDTLSLMYGKLCDGGQLHFGTDFFDYYLQAKVLVALHGGFRLARELAPEDVLSSIYGQKFVDANKPIHIFSAVRAPSADEPGQEKENQRKVDGNVHRDEAD